MSLFAKLFGSENSATVIASALDLVTYAASLASNPTQIDPLLDEVRSTTAHLAPGASLSPAEEQALLRVYLQLERYLTTKEPIRTFTVEGLRGKLLPELRNKLEQYETAKPV